MPCRRGGSDVLVDPLIDTKTIYTTTYTNVIGDKNEGKMR